MPERRPAGTRRPRRRAAALTAAPLLLAATALLTGPDRPGRPPKAAAAPAPLPAAAPPTASARSSPAARPGACAGTTTATPASSWTTSPTSPRANPRPIKVLTSAKLAQIHVPYDDGKNEYDDLTGQGFAQGLMKLDPAECPGGTIKTVRVPGAYDAAHPDVKGLCTTTRARGHAYRMGADRARRQGLPGPGQGPARSTPSTRSAGTSTSPSGGSPATAP